MSPIHVSASKTDNPRMQVLDLRQVTVSRSSESTTVIKEGNLDIRELENIPFQFLKAPKAWAFGDPSDGVVEMAAIVQDKGAIEIGYYYGNSKPKNIIKISSQVGCPASCRFCDAGQEKFRRNLTAEEIYEQVALMIQVLADYYPDYSAKPHKISITGTGEPLLNSNLVEGMRKLDKYNFSYKIATIFPAGKQTRDNFLALAKFAAEYTNTIQLQISLVSTDEKYRRDAIGISLATFVEIREAAEHWHALHPERSQVNLSLIISEDTPVDVNAVKDIFPSNLFRFRFRNYMPTEHGRSQGLELVSQERMLMIKDSFRNCGYFVGDDATPTPTEMEFELASNVTRRRMMVAFGIPIKLKPKS